LAAALALAACAAAPSAAWAQLIESPGPQAPAPQAAAPQLPVHPLAVPQAPISQAPISQAPVPPVPVVRPPAAPAPIADGPIGRPPAADGLAADTPSLQVAEAMQRMHLTACAPGVQRAMDFLFEGQPASFIAQPLGSDSDRWPAVFVIESAGPAGTPTRFSTLMVTPNCAGMYQQEIYWSKPCDVIKATIFPNFHGEHVLRREIRVSDAGPSLQVYLAPAGAGCVSIKKELFH
jgi:hypothetical protein